MAVHHIDVDPVGARRLDGLDLRAQPGEIRRQDGGRDQDGLWPCEFKCRILAPAARRARESSAVLSA